MFSLGVNSSEVECVTDNVLLPRDMSRMILLQSDVVQWISNLRSSALHWSLPFLLFLVLDLPQSPLAKLHSRSPPLYNSIPSTSFSCDTRSAGYYADMEAQCQVYHLCDPNGRMYSYLCPNMTAFHQQMMVCDHWHRVECQTSEEFYAINEKLKSATEFLHVSPCNEKGNSKCNASPPTSRPVFTVFPQSTTTPSSFTTTPPFVGSPSSSKLRGILPKHSIPSPTDYLTTMVFPEVRVTARSDSPNRDARGHSESPLSRIPSASNIWKRPADVTRGGSRLVFGVTTPDSIAESSSPATYTERDPKREFFLESNDIGNDFYQGFPKRSKFSAFNTPISIVKEHSTKEPNLRNVSTPSTEAASTTEIASTVTVKSITVSPNPTSTSSTPVAKIHEIDNAPSQFNASLKSSDPATESTPRFRTFISKSSLLKKKKLSTSPLVTSTTAPSTNAGSTNGFSALSRRSRGRRRRLKADPQRRPQRLRKLRRYLQRHRIRPPSPSPFSTELDEIPALPFPTTVSYDLATTTETSFGSERLQDPEDNLANAKKISGESFQAASQETTASDSFTSTPSTVAFNQKSLTTSSGKPLRLAEEYFPSSFTTESSISKPSIVNLEAEDAWEPLNSNDISVDGRTSNFLLPRTRGASWSWRNSPAPLIQSTVSVTPSSLAAKAEDEQDKPTWRWISSFVDTVNDFQSSGMRNFKSGDTISLPWWVLPKVSLQETEDPEAALRRDFRDHDSATAVSSKPSLFRPSSCPPHCIPQFIKNSHTCSPCVKIR
ncbi:unnamed protein product [Cyprideis torosa]|uniref:Uncharacterized protein n=1 Tax=Cyprideis torosa TaxID=163714 RepID=A0A7R8WCG0_9CRUS|nr:unnamed protein product [Cyprideis torosa]CAG0887365.1 unnamed protein product [Cyprideis torosa]